MLPSKPVPGREAGFNLITMSILLAVAGIVMVQFLPETWDDLTASQRYDSESRRG
jgi:hypothetical protein